MRRFGSVLNLPASDMLIDARNIPETATLDADVCIVGGGVAGIALARELAGRAFSVMLLESGGLETSAETQALDEGTNAGFPYYPLDTARARSLSGSSALWHVPLGANRVGARMRPMDPLDFDERDWVPYSGWPFAASHLASYYERAQAMCGLGAPSFAVEDWEDARERPRLPLPEDLAQTIIYKFCCREHFGRRVRQAVLDAENVTTCLHANVLRIETDSAGSRVTRLKMGTLPGGRFEVTARQFVLAAGGIEIPRLMLLSNRTHTAGLGNEHGLVGRFFMEHLHFWSGILVPDDPDVFARTALYNDVQTVNDVPVLGKLALPEAVIRRERLLNQNIQLIPARLPDPFKHPRLSGKPVDSLKTMLRGEGGEDIAQHLRNIAGGWDQFAKAGLKRVRSAVARLPERPVFLFANMTEQIPNPRSRVTLGEKRDAFGQRQAQLEWEIDAQDIRSAVRTQKLVGAALERAGIGRVFLDLDGGEPPRQDGSFADQRGTHGGYHHMGTTRMHRDPKQGVVDPECRVHGLANLYIAGPSVFPTGGYANPALTIMSLSIRLGDHLARSAA